MLLWHQKRYKKKDQFIKIEIMKMEYKVYDKIYFIPKLFFMFNIFNKIIYELYFKYLPDIN